MWELIAQGMNTVFTLDVLVMAIAGLTVGIVAGGIPGLNAGIAIALMLPATYKMEFFNSLVFLTSIYTGGVFGGAVTAILINAPGAPAAIATVFDGYPMTKKGMSNEALGLSLGASALGGLLGMVFLLYIISPLAQFALKFGPPEMFLLVVLALTSIASISRTDLAKGLLAGLFGILLGSVGMTASGTIRFTFGSVYLIDGIPVIPALIGFIAVSELLTLIGKDYITQSGGGEKQEFRKILAGIAMVPRNLVSLVRSSLIGIGIGAVPGVGATVGSIISYDVAKRFSKRSEEFGSGIPEGVIAAEAANNASEGGAMATMLALGIPGGAATAILIGAFTLQGLIPGPRLLIENKELVYSLICAEMIEEILLLMIGAVIASFFVRALYVPTRILVPLIMVICFLGAFSVRNTFFDAYLLFGFGLLGWIMKKHGYPVIATVIGIILGPIADAELLRTYQMYGDNMTVFLMRPICLTLVIFITLSLVFTPVLQFVRSRWKQRGNGA